MSIALYVDGMVYDRSMILILGSGGYDLCISVIFSIYHSVGLLMIHIHIFRLQRIFRRKGTRAATTRLL